MAIVLDYLFDVILSQRFVRTFVSLVEWADTVGNCFPINNYLHVWHLFPVDHYSDYKYVLRMNVMRADKATLIIPLI